MSCSLFELVADPVRLAIIRELSGSASVPLAQIAEHAGLHANTVRTHIGELESSGAVEREHAASDGPGRPQVRYRLRPGWHGIAETSPRRLRVGSASHDPKRQSCTIRLAPRSALG